MKRNVLQHKIDTNKYLSYSRETARRLLNFESQNGKKIVFVT